MAKKKTDTKKAKPKKEDPKEPESIPETKISEFNLKVKARKVIVDALAAHKCPRCMAFGYHPDYNVKVSGTEIKEYICGNCGLRLPADQVPE